MKACCGVMTCLRDGSVYCSSTLPSASTTRRIDTGSSLAQVGLAVGRRHGRADHDAAVGKDGIGKDHVQQLDLAAAERDGEAVVALASEARDAHPVGNRDDVLDAGVVGDLDGRDVLGEGQGLADAQRTPPLAVHVLRDVRRVGAVVEGRPHVHDHGGGRERRLGIAAGIAQVGGAEGRDVGKGLEGRAGLAIGGGDVDLAVDAVVKVVDAAHHGQDLAGVRAAWPPGRRCGR